MARLLYLAPAVGTLTILSRRHFPTADGFFLGRYFLAFTTGDDGFSGAFAGSLGRAAGAGAGSGFASCAVCPREGPP